MIKFSMIKKIILVFGAFVFVSIYLFFPKQQEFEFIALGSVPFKIIAEKRSNYNFLSDKKEIVNLVSELENIYSSKLPGSELSIINNKAGDEFIEISSDLRNIIRHAIEISKITNGAFDITVKPIIDLWISASKNNKIPSSKEIFDVKQIVGFNLLNLVDSKIHFRKKNVMIDLGGIAKGTVIDKIVKLMIGRGIKNGLVDAGGDIRVFGNKEYLIGVVSPNSAEIVGSLKCHNSSVVTSGNYARYSVIDGKKFSHIVDPRTAIPLEDVNTSVTVIASNAETADAYATGFMVLGNSKSKSIVNNLNEDIGVVFVSNVNDSIVLESMLDNTNCLFE